MWGSRLRWRVRTTSARASWARAFSMATAARPARSSTKRQVGRPVAAVGRAQGEGEHADAPVAGGQGHRAWPSGRPAGGGRRAPPGSGPARPTDSSDSSGRTTGSPVSTMPRISGLVVGRPCAARCRSRASSSGSAWAVTTSRTPVVVDQVDGAGVGDVGDGQAGHPGEGLLVVERRAEHPAGLGQEPLADGRLVLGRVVAGPVEGLTRLLADGVEEADVVVGEASSARPSPRARAPTGSAADRSRGRRRRPGCGRGRP